MEIKKLTAKEVIAIQGEVPDRGQYTNLMKSLKKGEGFIVSMKTWKYKTPIPQYFYSTYRTIYPIRIKKIDKSNYLIVKK